MAYHKLIVGIIALVACVGRSDAQEAPKADDAAAVLKSVRASLGLANLRAHKGGIRLVGEGRRMGEPSRTEYVFDPQWRFTIDKSTTLTYKAWFDGKTSWVRDEGGEVHECWVREHAELMSELSVVTGMLLAEGAGPVWSIDKERTTAQTAALIADVDQGRTVAVVEIDRGTWRPRRWRFAIGGRASGVELDGVLEFGGIKFPREVRRGGETLKLTAAEDAAPDEERYRAKSSRPTDTTFDASKPARVEAKATPDQRVLIRVGINGKDAGWFLFDSGCNYNIIDPRVAAEFGLGLFGETGARGIGPDAAAARLARVERLTLGPMTIRDALVVVCDMGLEIQGEKVRGAIGYPLLARCVAEFDARAPRLDVFNPESYKLPKGRWQRMEVNERMPILPGSCEGNKAIVTIDTGGVPLMFFQPTVRRWKMAENRALEPGEVEGSGGPSKLLCGTVRSFTLGGCEWRDAPAGLSTDRKGCFAENFVDASVGVELLRSAVLVIDYPGQRAAVVTREEWNGKPVERK